MDIHQRNIQVLANHYDRWKQTVPVYLIDDLNDDPPLEENEKEEELNAGTKDNRNR